MLARAFAAEVPAAWVTGDEIYGNDGALRRWLEAQSRPYVLAVARTHPVWDNGVQVRVDALVEGIPEAGWQRIDVGAGSKGPRIYDWACGRVPYETAASQRTWPSIAPLAMRRPRLRIWRTWRARAGRSRKGSSGPRRSAWTSMRSGAGKGGTGMSRCACSLMPS
jgi:SRSO17 transposase